MVFVAALPGPCRADDRAAGRLRDPARARSSAPRTPEPRPCSSRVGHLSKGFRLPEPALQLWAETDVFDEERRTHERRRSATRGVPLGLPRPEGRRPRRPRRSRHRRVRRPEADRGRHRRAGVHGAALCGRRQAVRSRRTARSRSEVHRRVPSGARSPRRHHVGEGQDARQEGDARHGGGAAEALRLAPRRAGARLQSRQPLAAGVRGRVRMGADDRSAERDHRHQARHGVADADGPPALRRRRLRQDRSGDARRVQGGDGRQAGGVAGADDRPRLPAPEDAARSLCRHSRCGSTW